MIKSIRILEVPLLLLIIAMQSIGLQDPIGLAIFLILISILRLIVNVMTDGFIYKKKRKL